MIDLQTSEVFRCHTACGTTETVGHLRLREQAL